MIITREDARIAITTRLEAVKATWTEYPLIVEYTNSVAVNPSEQTNPWLKASILYHSGEQVGLGIKANYRALGTLLLEARDRPGRGNARVNRLIEHFFRPMHMTDLINPVRTYAARLVSATTDEWIAETAIIPFWYDTATS